MGTILFDNLSVEPSSQPLFNAAWLDTRGDRIEAHGGCVLHFEGSYYWYGEDHHLGRGNKTGINCYRSSDLKDWECLGTVLPKEAVPEIFRDDGACERPKVLYCRKSRMFVMWVHLAANSHIEADAGIAISTTPGGPFTFIRQFRPIRYAYEGMPAKQWAAEPDARIDLINERERGGTFRDFTLFRDDDGKAYVFYASENNLTLYVAELNRSYTNIVRPVVLGRTWNRLMVNGRREAPAVFKTRDKYYMIHSGCTSWAPNPVHWSTADHPLGPWEDLGSAFAPELEETGGRTQPAHVFAAPMSSGMKHFIYVGDRWDGADLARSEYVWIPFDVPTCLQT